MVAVQTSHVVFVTGANRGIGYGIVRRLAKQYEGSYVNQQNSLPLKIYLGSRSVEKGNEALQKLKGELTQKELKCTEFAVCQLDMNDPKSHAHAAKTVKENDGGLDALISNAGIAMDGFDANVVKQTFATNYHGVTSFNETVLPILRKDGRIVIVASIAGALTGYSQEIVQRFRNVSTASEADVMAKEFEDAVQAGKHKEKGWKDVAYGTSKACVIAYTRGKANDLRKEGRDDVLINSVCPGYVNTDMVSPSHTRFLSRCGPLSSMR